MSEKDRKRLKEIHTFPALVKYLRDDLGWPVEQDSFDDLDEITFDWEADELGIDPGQAAKIEYIKQLRPLENGQPQGVFFVKFDTKNLPVVALRRLLGKLVVKKRATAAAAERPLWAMRDLVFISSYGESEERQLSFAYFQEPEHKTELPSLKVLGWEDGTAALQLDRVHDLLAAHLTWPDSPKSLPTWRKGWSAAFELRHGEIVTTAKQLAEQLAALARGIRERANQLLKLETETGPLRTLMAGFKTALIHDLTEDQFADMYAQTIAYGLLSARITHPDPVKAETLPDLIPVTNPFLKELMETFVLAGGKHRGRKRGLHLDFDELGINDVVELLRRANMNAVLRNFGAGDRKEDPVTYFYEDFLNAYDAVERKRRGVYYTPKSVVSYIVRSVHELLQSAFGIEDGLASTITWGELGRKHKDLKIPAGVAPDSPFVQILDPATGTATFPVTVIEVIFETLTGRWRREGLSEAKRLEAWNTYVPKHLLPRLYGYELMMAPYAIAHLKIGLKLFETGYRFGSDERARIYLTNALEPASDASLTQIDALSEALAHEGLAVNQVKRLQVFTVVLGNPPYSLWSQNLTDAARSIIDPYRLVEGEVIREKGALQFEKILQDDYIKFFCSSQVLIDRAGCGSLGLITNHSFVDNPTLRGMRHSLLESFDQVFCANLHGNSAKKERAPDGTADHNVFDIQQGVAIFLGARLPNRAAKVTRMAADIWGSREEKYRLLSTAHISDLPYHGFSASRPAFFFKTQDEAGAEEYQAGWKLPEVFSQGSMGVVTARDHISIGFDDDEVLRVATEFRDSRLGDATLCEKLDIPAKKGWDVAKARAALRQEKDLSRLMQDINYRPFDTRRVFYHRSLVWGMSWPTMQHVVGRANIGLSTTRSIEAGHFRHVFCSNRAIGHHFVSLKEVNYFYPLWLYPSTAQLDLTEHPEPNLTARFAAAMADAVVEAKGSVGSMRQPMRAEDVFAFVYSVLHSPAYRARYDVFLRQDFPRIPLPGSAALFRDLAGLGGDLIALHIMESSKRDDFITTYDGPRNPEVGRVGWSDDTVWLDAATTKKGQDASPGTIGFHGVPEAVWNFHIGGYQVCEKWLKDRKGRKLAKDDIEHYQKIVVALSETIRIMKEIDEVIEKHGGWPGAFRTGQGDEKKGN